LAKHAVSQGTKAFAQFMSVDGKKWEAEDNHWLHIMDGNYPIYPDIHTYFAILPF
jgi:hypothetical protein